MGRYVALYKTNNWLTTNIFKAKNSRHKIFFETTSFVLQLSRWLIFFFLFL